MTTATAPKDPAQAQAREEALAQLLEQLTQDGGLKSLRERIKGLENHDVDLKAVVQRVDELKSQNERIVATIRSSRRGLYFPGVEDQPFNLTRALLGIRLGFEKVPGSQHEKAIMEAATAKARELATKASIQQIGEDTLGGFFIPDQVIPDVIAAIYRRSVMLSLSGEGETRVSVADGLVGGEVKIPRFEGGLIAYWVGEMDDIAESVAKVGDISLNPKQLGVLLRITQSMRDMAGYGFDSLLRNDLIRAAAKKLDHGILLGKGGAAPRGLINTDGIKVFSAQSQDYGVLGTNALGSSPFQADWDGGELTYDGLQKMDLAMAEDDVELADGDVSTISSHRYFMRLKQIKVDHYSGQTTKQAYLLGMPMLTAARLREVIGDFAGTNNIPANDVPGAQIGAPQSGGAAKFTTVIRGDLKQVVVGRWGGIQVEDDAGRGKGFAAGHIYMKLVLKADVNVRQPRAIVVCPDATAKD